MSDPLTPNFKPNVGARLATDRFDFQHHVDGYNLRHNADAISLSPIVTINGSPSSNVQDAITKLTAFVSPPDIIVSDATLFAKGIVQLSGDLGGTAIAPKVLKIQGFAVSTQTPTNNQVLTWNGVNWVPSTPVSTFFASNDLFGNNATQTVVGIQSRAVANILPSNGQVLTWISGNNRWEPITVIPSSSGFATVTSGTFDGSATANIRYTGGKFQTDANIQFKSGAVLGDLVWAPATTNKTLTLPNATDTLIGLATVDTVTNKTINLTFNTITDVSTAVGDILVSDGSKFLRKVQGTNGTFLGVSGGVLGYYSPSTSTPSGTGFATTTSGVFDSPATANIRYIGGKFQTDLSIQFKSGSFIGDLAWGVTASNKVLTLPDATDTLVGLSTTDTLANKTISVSSNSLTATSQAAGDLLKNNGSSFQRFARGSALQVLRVNAGGTDLEWAASASGSTSAGVTNSVQLSDGSGGFLANATLGLTSGGSLKMNISSTAIEHFVPLSGQASGTNAYRLQLAAVSAFTVSGPYTPSGTEAASPTWVISAGSNDGYINMPAQTGAVYYIMNTSGSTLRFRATGDSGTAANVNGNSNAIIIHNGTRYITFINV